INHGVASCHMHTSDLNPNQVKLTIGSGPGASSLDLLLSFANLNPSHIIPERQPCGWVFLWMTLLQKRDTKER
ncbi:hypothetical protein CFP56_007373, partial [Quercus suber]